MIDLGINLFQEIAALGGGGGGYSITNSLRFNDNDSAYLSRTPATASNRKTFTWSGWVKRGNIDTGQNLFSVRDSSTTRTVLRINATNNLEWLDDDINFRLITSSVLRDVSGWYHIVAVADTTQVSSSDRLKFYINGVQVLSFSTSTYPSQNYDTEINSTRLHAIGREGSTTNDYFDGYLAEINFIDGQALTADDFGQIDATTGEWSPIAYAGTYGTNGFYLPFDGNANDDSGNGNNWTENNLASTDYMIDTPTNNFSVLNPLDPLTTGTLSDGNLVTSGSAKVSLRPTSGQWYYEKDGVGISYDADTSGQFNPTLAAGSYNFGQYAWADTGPTGTEKSLCTDNLPAPTIEQPETQFNVVTYTGNGTSQAITGVGFQPDMVWIKVRSTTYGHQIHDSVRGAGLALFTDATDAEFNVATVTSFDSDGFTVDASSFIGTNASGQTFVAWCWKAGGTAVSNTDGAITSSVSANVDAGFSVATYTGNGSTGTIGHGLNKKPDLVIIKNRGFADNWFVGGPSFGTNNYLALNSTSGMLNYVDGSGGSFFNYGGWSDSVVNVYNNNAVAINSPSYSYVMYSFHSVEGFSKFGSYVGNGSTNGPFVYTGGFKPAFLLIKRTDSTSNWTIIDNEREGYNVDNDPLYANLANVEGTADLFDILSNGFKCRSTDASINASGGTYIYMAFAEHPFKEALAR